MVVTVDTTLHQIESTTYQGSLFSLTVRSLLGHATVCQRMDFYSRVCTNIREEAARNS